MLILDTENPMNAVEKFLPLLGRILIALIFIRGGINKLGAIDGTVAQMSSHGVPLSNILVWGAIALELGGGLMLIAGLLTRWVALALFFYTLVLALIFHAYWTMPEAVQREQAASFFGHLAMMGGMLFVVAFGAGAWSFDSLMGRKT
jgi:putative oxidoreductase